MTRLPSNFGAMGESDTDYPPDDESFSDSKQQQRTVKENQVNNGKWDYLDNEFVFDREWSFRRMMTLESLLFAKLLSASNAKNNKHFVFHRSYYKHQPQHGKNVSNEKRVLTKAPKT